MPKLRSTLARGSVTVLTQSWLVAAIPITILVVWVLLTTLGFQGPFTAMSVTFAIPPITTFADAQVAGKTFRAAIGASGIGVAGPGLIGIASLLLFHAALVAVVTTLSVEKLRTGSVSAWAIRRAGRVLRTTAVVALISLGLLIAGNVLAAFLGGPGVIFGLIGSMVVGVYLFGFAATIATDEERRVTDNLVRSVRAARMPGSANLWLAVGYVLISLVTVIAPLPGSSIGVTPTVTAWAVVIAINVMHVIVQSTLAYRYLAVAPEVPDQPVARKAPARRR
ncbi:MAG: hypothetical protein ABJB55_01085 [Actinomycetota bacterium]